MERQPQAEGGALVEAAFQFDPPAMIAYDALHDHQTETAAPFLGGEKRFENAVDLILGNAAASVFDKHPNTLGGLAGFEGKDATLGHRLDGVLDEIDESLLDLGGVNRRVGQPASQLFTNGDSTVLD